MTWSAIFLTLMILTFLFLAGGMWISVAIGVASIIVMYLTGSANLFQILSNIAYNSASDFLISSIPLFLLMGEVLLQSNLSGRFYLGISKMLRRVPGGLIHSNLLGCGIFSAISGSSVATAAAIGGVAIPDQKRLHYDKRYIYGSLAAGGTLGILIPPSIALIIYGTMTDTSVVWLFKSALVPGVLLMLLYMGYIAVTAVLHKDKFAMVADNEEVKNLSWREAARGVWPFALLIFIILGSIYGGIATPTEAAALGTFVAIVIGRTVGELRWPQFKQAVFNAVKTTSMIIFIMLSAQIFSYVLTATGASRALVAWVESLNLSYYGLLLMVYLIYIVLGCFVESNAMQYLTLPVLFPILTAYGVDPLWFGIVLVILIELGQITPPVGINLFIIRGIDKNEGSMSEIIKGVLPFMLLMLTMVAILTAFPRLATFLYY